VDESMLNGEPVPVLKKENEKVFAGTINQKGSFQFKAVKVGKGNHAQRLRYWLSLVLVLWDWLHLLQ
jgi:cation transport ATPase